MTYLRIAAVLILAVPAILPAQQIAIGAYPIPTSQSLPQSIVSGPENSLWFTEYEGGKIGRIATSGAITEFTVPTPESGPNVITVGPDGALWFTEYYANQIGRLTPGGVFTEYPVPTPSSGLGAICTGHDGALWFTETSGNKVGRVTTSGVFTEFPISTPYTFPFGIVSGPDGALWFTMQGTNQIGRITTTGSMTAYTTPTVPSAPYYITRGPDGALWFAETEATKVGRITTAGVITELFLASNYFPVDLTTGPDGALWLTGTSGLARLTTGGVFTRYSGGRDGSVEFSSIAAGPDGELWYTGGIYDNIQQAVFVTANLSATPNQATYHSSIAFTGSAYLPNETVDIYRDGVGSTVLAQATADSAGNVDTNGIVPESPLGERFFLGLGTSSGRLGAAVFSMQPSITLSSYTGAPGATVTLSAYGFDSLSTLDIYWGHPQVLLGTVTADVNGSLKGENAFQLTVPSDASPGRNQVIVREPGVVQVKATFKVE